MQRFCRENELILQRINHYSLRDRQSGSNVFQAERPHSCHICNRLRLTADGKLKPCLFSNQEITVDFSDIKASIETAILSKPRQGVFCTNRENWQIGG
jgi:cyclic pyranopterin phosphate synthase